LSHNQAIETAPSRRIKGAGVFAFLYSLESFSRGLVSSVIPITAYELLKDEQKVSVLYTCVSLAGLCASLMIPHLIARLSRRWVYTLGAASLFAGALALASFSLPGQVAAMFCRVFGSSCLSIVLSLYIMDNVAKSELVRTESLRMASSTFAWSLGPFLGVYLYQTYGLWIAGAASSATAMILALSFWYFRLAENTPIRPARQRPASPIANFRRFFAQPRLRLAWFIAFARSAYWSTFFVYGPILMVATGQGKLAGGMFSSLGNVMLITGLMWARAAYRFSLRRSIVLCFLSCGILLLAAGAAGANYPLVAAAFLLAGTVGASGLDAIGSTAFLRAVKQRERPAMTSVYRTYLDFSDLAPSFVYSIALGLFGLGSVFVCLSALMFVSATLVWRYLPKSM
jgi:predicted MFS family arabinose efflux permease